MPSEPAVFAIAAHPDDIEFVMSGTMMLLKEKGWDLHVLNIANGSCGTVTEPPEAIVARRRGEAMDACRCIGAEYHESLCNDLEILYSYEMVARVMAPIRRARPRVLLVHSPQDYMEDHQNAARIAVTAAFCRGMRNYASDPPADPVMDDITVYHALPHGLRDPMRRRVRPGLYVDVTPVIGRKRTMLACHRSQKEWLDRSQGMDAYLDAMLSHAAEVGALSGRYRYAEGWRRRLHLGYSAADSDPLADALGPLCLVDEAYERELEV